MSSPGILIGITSQDHFNKYLNPYEISSESHLFYNQFYCIHVLTMSETIHLILLVVLLFQLLLGVSSRWPQDLPIYTASVIQYYAKQKPGRFESVFYDISAGTDKGLYSKLLQSHLLSNVAKYTMDEKFQASFDNFPVNPSVAVMYVGERNLMPPNCPILVRHFLATLDSNAKVIVLVNTENADAFQSIMSMLVHLRFDKVIYIGTVKNIFIRMKFNGTPDRVVSGMPHPSDLIRSNIRNAYGRPIAFTFRFAPWNQVQQWVFETARHLNTNLTFYPKICTEATPVHICMERLFKAFHIDIALDQCAPQELLGQNYRMIVGRTLNSRVILVPQGRLFSAVEVFTKPFAWKSWIVLLLILFSIEALSWVFPALFRNDPILLSLCGIEKYDLHRACIREKVTLLPMILFCFLMCNAYETKIISFMTNKPSVGNIETLDELVKSGIKIAANLQGDERLVNDSLLGPQIIPTPPNSDYNRLDDQYAHLSNNLEAPWMVSLLRNYDFVVGRPRFSILRERISISIYTFWIGVMSCFAETLHHTQKVFFEAGLMDKWDHEQSSGIMARDRAEFRRMETIPSGMLSFGDLISTWFILGAGLFFSITMFMLELMINCCGALSRNTILKRKIRGGIEVKSYSSNQLFRKKT